MRKRFPHTRLVRGGSLMLEPTWDATALASRARTSFLIPTSHEVGMRKNNWRLRPGCRL